MLPLTSYDSSLHASSRWVAGRGFQQGAGGFYQVIPTPYRNLRDLAGATCAIPFFDPLEAEFEKIVLTKIVALAMLYLVLFENLKKVNF